MIPIVGLITLTGGVLMAFLLPTIVFLDKRVSYRWAVFLAVLAVAVICITLAGIAVLVVADGQPL